MLKAVLSRLAMLAAGVLSALLPLTSPAQSSYSWPHTDRMDTSAFEQRFETLFASQPDHLPELVTGLVKCDLSSVQARQLSNTSEDIFESAHRGSQYVVDVDIHIDMKSLDIYSTATGCKRLKTVSLMTIKYGSTKQFKVPDSFREPIKVKASYHHETRLTMDINGNRSDTTIELEQRIEFIDYQPKKPVHPDYPRETIHVTHSDNFEGPAYAALFSPVGKSAEALNIVALNSMSINGKASNTIAFIATNDSGQSVQTSYGETMLITTVDGQMHGLMITENFQYKTDKSADPLMRSCYNMGEKVNVFKITENDGCAPVDESQVGQSDVYVDTIYQMQSGIKIPNSVSTTPSESRKPNIAQQTAIADQQKLNTRFSELQQAAKCALKNSDWVYTGDACKEGLAHGKGSAEDRMGLKFVGRFEAGQRIKGEIHRKDEMIFTGELVDDKPSGDAICLHQGEYEECRFFRGKRIDALYKMRQENARLQQQMAKMQKSSDTTSAHEKGTMDYASEALKREGSSRAAEFIFDKLF